MALLCIKKFWRPLVWNNIKLTTVMSSSRKCSSKVQDSKENSISEQLKEIDQKYKELFPELENVPTESLIRRIARSEYRFEGFLTELITSKKNLSLAVDELNNIKHPVKLANEIEFYEELLASTFAPLESDLKNYKGTARTIQSRKLKWKFILKIDHPSVNALKDYLDETEYEAFAEAMAVLYSDIKRYLGHALRFCSNDTIPKLEITKKEEFDKYIAVILRNADPSTKKKSQSKPQDESNVCDVALDDGTISELEMENDECDPPKGDFKSDNRTKNPDPILPDSVL